MYTLSTNDKEFIEQDIVQEFSISDLRVGMEKLYWHIANKIYDQEIVMNILHNTFAIEQTEAKKISALMIDRAKEFPIEKSEVATLEPAQTIEVDEAPVYQSSQLDILMDEADATASAAAIETPVAPTTTIPSFTPKGMVETTLAEAPTVHINQPPTTKSGVIPTMRTMATDIENLEAQTTNSAHTDEAEATSIAPAPATHEPATQKDATANSIAITTPAAPAEAEEPAEQPTTRWSATYDA